MSDLYGPDPEPPEGDYYDGLDTPEQSGVVPPEADEYEPPTCDRCGTLVDDFQQWCEECGNPLTRWAEYWTEHRQKHGHYPLTDAVDAPF